MNNNFPKVFIIILNYNGKNTLKECLTGAFQTDYPNFEVVVVDNNSQDGSFELAKNYFPKAHFIKNEKNLGFAAGNNIGIRFALERMADYVFLLNNDAVVSKNTLSELIKAAQSEELKSAGIFSPVIFKENTRKIWFAGGKINWLKMRAEHITHNAQRVTRNAQRITRNLQRKIWNGDKINKLQATDYKLQTTDYKLQTTNYKLQATDYVTGCAMLIKKEVFKKIGLLDENFFLYYEDADFCRRAGKEGFKSAVVFGAGVKHYEKSEEDKIAKTYWLVVSGVYFFRKNSPWFLKPWIFIYLAARKIKNKIDVALGKGGKLAKEVARAYKDVKNAE